MKESNVFYRETSPREWGQVCQLVTWFDHVPFQIEAVIGESNNGRYNTKNPNLDK